MDPNLENGQQTANTKGGNSVVGGGGGGDGGGDGGGGGGGRGSTKTLKKKDALLKPQFDRLPVIREQKLKKRIKALVLSFHLRRPAAL